MQAITFEPSGDPNAAGEAVGIPEERQEGGSWGFIGYFIGIGVLAALALASYAGVVAPYCGGWCLKDPMATLVAVATGEAVGHMILWKSQEHFRRRHREFCDRAGAHPVKRAWSG